MKEPNYDKRIVIAYVIDFLASQDNLTGGTERQLIELLNHIDQSRFRPILFCLQKFVDTPYWDTIRCEKHLLHVYSLASLRSIRAFISFVRFLRQHSVDIVQTYFHDSTLFGILAAKLSGARKAISCRRDLGFWYEDRLLNNLLLVNKLTDRILVNCTAVKDAAVLHEHLSPGKIDIIHNGLDLEAFDRVAPIDLRAEFPEIRNGDNVIGMVANYNREVKRVDLFIRAAAEVVRHHDDVRFLIIGGGGLENELKGLISSLGLEGRVILGGKRDPAISYIKDFDIGVLTSDSEGFSNVLLEYMAAGIPVVATEVGGNPEIVQNDTLGLLIPKGDFKALASAICSLLNHHIQRKEMGMNARKHIVDQYSWDMKVKEIERYYEEFVGL